MVKAYFDPQGEFVEVTIEKGRGLFAYDVEEFAFSYLSQEHGVIGDLSARINFWMLTNAGKVVQYAYAGKIETKDTFILRYTLEL